MGGRLSSNKRVLWGLACALLLVMAPPVIAERSLQKSIELDSQKRTYLLHAPTSLPPDRSLPLVFVFHGGGGDGAGMERLTHFSNLADREGFVAVYPDGRWKNWNDGREPTVSRAHRENVDDISFISALIEQISRDYRIDPKRIFATGISNGGIFSHYLAANLSARIAAIAPVVGGIPERFQDRFRPERPVSVFIIQGTDDPLVPFHGGGILQGRRGRIIDTKKAARLWVEHNGCVREARTGMVPDANPRDGCLVKWFSWENGLEGTEVKLYIIEGGGHAWPGGAQYLPVSLIGKVCRDFDGKEIIWEFFKRHPKP